MSEDKTKPPPELVNMVLSQITKEVKQYKADLAKAKERITELEAALRPFAEAYNRDKGLPATMGGNNWGASWESYEDAAALMGDGDKAQEGDDEKETG